MLCRSFYWISGRKQLLEKFHNHRPAEISDEKQQNLQESAEFEAQNHPKQFIYIENNHFNNYDHNESTQIMDQKASI